MEEDKCCDCSQSTLPPNYDPNKTVTVTFAGLPCEPIVFDPMNEGLDDSLTCTLPSKPPAGCYSAIMTDCYGAVTNIGDPICIPLIIDDVDLPPGEVCLNRNGGQVITINGSGFDVANPFNNEVRLGRFAGILCDVISATENSVTCTTRTANKGIGDGECGEARIRVNEISSNILVDAWCLCDNEN